MHFAALRGYLRVVKTLVEGENANPLQVNKHGHLPIDFAIPGTPLYAYLQSHTKGKKSSFFKNIFKSKSKKQEELLYHTEYIEKLRIQFLGHIKAD